MRKQQESKKKKDIGRQYTTKKRQNIITKNGDRQIQKKE